MKKQKGARGYLQYKKKTETLMTVFLFTLSLAVYALGYLTTGSNKNLLTIVAVLGCLPASKSAVSMIMYWKAGFCSEACFQRVRAMEDSIPLLYDLYLTSYQKNFQISVLAVRNGCVCGCTESPACDTEAGERHITEILTQNGQSRYTVKLFSDLDKFALRLEQMALQEEGRPKSAEEVKELIFSISL